MSCLPNEYVPLRGSEGERMRARLYLNQLPPHDTNPASCHTLSDLEKKRLLKFAERRKSRSSGVGKVVMLEQDGQKVLLPHTSPTQTITHSQSHTHTHTCARSLYKPCCFGPQPVNLDLCLDRLA